jgi:hypothetical protein
VGLDNTEFQVVRNHQFKHPHEKFESPDVETNPVWQFLAPGGFGIGVIGRSKHGNKDLRLVDLPNGQVNITDAVEV